MTLIGRRSSYNPFRAWMDGKIALEPLLANATWAALWVAHVSIQFSSDDLPRYFFGVSTGVGTLSMTDDEPRKVVM
jgi:hypothetical protein